MTTNHNDMLFVFDRPLSGSHANRELLDMAMAAAAFDQPVALLFRGPAALWVATQDADPRHLEQKDLFRQLGALPIYGVNRLYVEGSALTALGVEAPAIGGVEVVDAPTVAQLYQSFDRIVQW